MPAVTGNKTPLYAQIAQTIKHRVRTGVYGVGDVLPTVRELGREFGVSVKSVHQAIRSLEESGIVQAHPRRGIRVVKEDGCDKAAIYFGLIIPYSVSDGFHHTVLEYVDDVFSERHNYVIVRSSKDDSAVGVEYMREFLFCCI